MITIIISTNLNFLLLRKFRAKLSFSKCYKGTTKGKQHYVLYATIILELCYQEDLSIRQ